jgi:hypothetical protein
MNFIHECSHNKFIFHQRIPPQIVRSLITPQKTSLNTVAHITEVHYEQ